MFQVKVYYSCLTSKREKVEWRWGEREREREQIEKNKRSKIPTENRDAYMITNLHLYLVNKGDP